MPDPKTIQRVVERFQTAYTLEDETRLGRPHTLSDDDRTELRDHMEEHPGTSALPNSLVTSAKQCGRYWKKKAFFPTEYQCCTN